jgi:hypothetical protein
VRVRFELRFKRMPHKFGPAELCTRSQSYRASEKTGLSENKKTPSALGEVQRSAPKQRHTRPNGRTSDPGEPMCLGSVAEGVGFEPTIRFPVYTLSKRAP